MMDKTPYSQIQKGTFLLATPDIEGGIFFRSVILVCEHNKNGSFGLVINKNIELELPEEVLNVQNMENEKVQILAGGPIQTNQMMLLHTSDKIPKQTLQICKDVFLGGDLVFLQEVLNDKEGPQIKLCFGYSGWAGAQLEREFLDGHWLIYPASKKLVFETPAEKLWQTILKEIGGKYASLSMIPEDLSLN